MNGVILAPPWMRETTYTIQELSGPSDEVTEPGDINASGAVAGGTWVPVGEAGAIWSGPGQPSTIAEATASFFYGINDAGDAVGYLEGPTGTPTEQAVLLRGRAATYLSATVGIPALATGINNAGLICGSRWNGPKAFVFDSTANAISADISPLPGGTHAWATAISQTGEVVGGSQNSQDSGSNGFVYSGGTLTDLGPAAFVEDINESGQVCGSIGKPWPQAFSPGIWDISLAAPTFTEIPVPDGFLGGHAQGINNKGQVVGTCWTPQTYDLDQSAYVYSNGGSNDLNTLIPGGTGWKLQSAEKINDNGQITGWGQYGGQRQAFLLTPLKVRRIPVSIPLPELIAILIFGGVTVDGGGWAVLPGGPPIPIGPWGPVWADMQVEKRDALLSMALDEFAKNIEDVTAREVVRRAILETLRKQVDKMLETPRAGRTIAEQPGQVQQQQSGKLPHALLRFGARSRQ
jgi:probable HAF family extracellular repeat protein